MAIVKKVLIIDDEVELCHLLKKYFSRKNHDVYISHTLKDGKEIMDREHPDVVFLDNNLPDGIGWNLAPFFTREYPDTFLVLVSAFHPKVPEDMPSKANYTIIEKPMSLSDIDSSLAGVI